MTKPVLLCGPHSSFLSTVIYLFSQLASRVIKLFERTYLIKEIVIIIMLSGAVVTLFCMIVGASAFTVEEGVDISSPMHHAIQNRSSMFAKRHEETMAQCYATYSQTECEIAEQQRLATNRDQPKMQHNYTEVGFKLSRVPDSIMQDIQKFYQDNKDREQPEIWTRGFSSINSWVSPTTMVRLEDPVNIFYEKIIAALYVLNWTVTIRH